MPNLGVGAGRRAAAQRFEIQRGPQGPPGEPGPAGVTGATGPTGAAGAPADLPQVTFSPEGVDTSGVVSAFTAVRVAWNAAIAACQNDPVRAVVQLPAGTILMDDAAHPDGLPLPADLVGDLVIRGHGVTGTTVKTGTSSRCFVSFDVTDGGALAYCRNFTIEDLTVDAGGFAARASTPQAVVFGCITRVNAFNLRFRRIDVINVGGIRTTAQRNVIAVSLYTDQGDPADFLTCTHIYADDVRINERGGGTGGGGNIGIIVQALGTGVGALTTIGTAGYAAGIRRCYVYFDEIHVRRCYWDSGTNAPTLTSSVGFMFGGYGYGDKLRMSDCVAKRSGDDSIEINSFLDAEILNCTTEDANSAQIYLRNIGGMPTPEIQSVRFIGCRSKIRKAAGASPTMLAHTTAAIPFGNVVFRDCTVEYVGSANPAPTLRLPPAIGAWGDFQSLTIENCHRVVDGWVAAWTANNTAFQSNAFAISQQGGRGTARIHNVSDTITGSFTGGAFTGCSLLFNTLEIGAPANLALDINGVETTNRIARSGNGSITLNNVSIVQGRSHTDSFGSDTWGALAAASNYVIDSGAQADLAVAGGVLTSAANHGTEKAARWIGSIADARAQAHGPYSDGGTWVKGLYSQTTGFKLGVILKATNATNRLEAYATDNGTATLLNLDKIVAGVRTNLATLTLGTRLTDATSYWVRGHIIGDAVNVDYFTAAPSTTAVTTAGVATVTHTLSSADAILLGKATQGRSGFVWVPAVATSTLDDLNFVRIGVLGGRVVAVRTSEVPATTNVTARGFNFGATAGQYRVPVNGPSLTVEECDFSTMINAATRVDFLGIAAFGRSCITAKCRRVAPPAPATTTVTTGTFAYTSEQGHEEDVSVYGGTVTAISLTRPGGTIQQVATTQWAGRLAPGDVLTIANSAAPTLARVAVL